MAFNNIAIGPAHLLLGNPTTAGGMVHLGRMESVSFDPGVAMTGVQDAFSGDAYMVDGIYSLPPSCSVTAELYEADIAKIAKMVLGGEIKTDAANGDAFGFGRAGLVKIDPENVPTLVVIPDFQKDSGLGAKNQIVLPAVALESLASIVYNRPAAGGNAANSFTATFKGAQRAKDQADTVIPEAFQFAWMGPVASVLGAAHGWTYPALQI